MLHWPESVIGTFYIATITEYYVSFLEIINLICLKTKY